MELFCVKFYASYIGEYEKPSMVFCMGRRFFYDNGQELLKGDRVKIANDYDAVVEEIFQPYTKEASDYGCFRSGGFMLMSEKIGCEVWADTDEDIELQERCNKKS